MRNIRRARPTHARPPAAVPSGPPIELDIETVGGEGDGVGRGVASAAAAAGATPAPPDHMALMRSSVEVMMAQAAGGRWAAATGGSWTRC